MLILTAIGLLLVLEGALYALFPDTVRRMMAQISVMPCEKLRIAGLAMTLAGFVIIYFITR